MHQKTLFALCGVLVLSACNIGSMARVNPNTVASYGVPDPRPGAKFGPEGTTNRECPLTSGLDDTEPGAINLDCFHFPGDADTKTAYQHASTMNGNEDKAAVHARNRLAAILMKHADDVCVLEKGRIVGREGALNFGLSTATTALSTVSTIVSGELAKSILSGGAAFTSGTRGHAAESFYRNQVTQAINAAMDGERAKVRAEMEKQRKEGLAAFTVDDMIRLANEYHQACSYERGLQLLVKAAVTDDLAASRNSATRMANLQLQLEAVKRELASGPTDTREEILEARQEKLEEAILAMLEVGGDDLSSDAGGQGTDVGSNQNGGTAGNGDGADEADPNSDAEEE